MNTKNNTNPGTYQELLAELLEFVGNKLDERAYRKFLHALEVAEKAHLGQIRDDGTPYLMHPLRVVLSLVKELDVWKPDLLCAALLHDVVEDSTELSRTDIDMLGHRVETIVQTLTKQRGPGMSRAEINKHYFDRLSQADEECKLVKLVDKLDNVRDAVNSPSLAKQQRTATEAKDFYLSLARNLSNAKHRRKLLALLSEAIDLLSQDPP